MLSAVSSVATASPLHRTLIGSGGRKEAPDLREDKPQSQPHEMTQDWFKPNIVMAGVLSSFVMASMLGRGSLSK